MKFLGRESDAYGVIAICMVILFITACLIGFSLFWLGVIAPHLDIGTPSVEPEAQLPPPSVEPIDKGFHDVVLNFILNHEGPGEAKEVGHGGYSYRGVTQQSWAEWRMTQGDRNDLPRAVRGANDTQIKRFYYDYFQSYNVWDVHPSLQLLYADFAVLSGHRATKDVQTLIGVARDGIWGTETRQAVSAFNQTLTTSEDRHAAFNRLDVMKRKFLMWLGEHPEHKRDLSGWIKRADDLKAYMQPYL